MTKIFACVYIFLELCTTNIQIYKQMTKEREERLPIAPTLKEMAVGACVEWPIERTANVRNSASLLGLQGLSFSCAVDRAKGVVRATRVK